MPIISFPIEILAFGLRYRELFFLKPFFSLRKDVRSFVALPIEPERNIKSPSFAPLRLINFPRSTIPPTCTVIDKPPLVVSPPISGILNSSDTSIKPCLKEVNQSLLLSFRVIESINQEGEAPHAAKSLKAIATER